MNLDPLSRAVALSLLLLGTSAWADAPAPQHRPTSAKAWTQAPAKHNGSGVALAYSVPTRLQPGQPAALSLQFSNVQQGDAQVRVRAPDGVQLARADGSALVSPVALPAGRSTLLQLRVTPSVEGMAYLDVFTAQGGRSGVQSVPLKVGQAQPVLRKSGQVQTTPAGEKVISLPSATR